MYESLVYAIVQPDEQVRLVDSETRFVFFRMQAIAFSVCPAVLESMDCFEEKSERQV